MTAAQSAGLRFALRFPTTLLIAAPHVLLFLPLAIWNGNPQTDFILQMGGIAALGTFLVEAAVAAVSLAERRSGRTPSASTRRSTPVHWIPGRVAAVARGVTIVSIVTNLASVLAGVGTLRAQIDSTTASGALSLLTPFVSWAYVAVALLVVAHHLGGLSRAAVLVWIGALLANQVLMAYLTNLTARATTFLVLLVVLAFLTNLVPRSWIAGGVGMLAVVWPTVFAIRNQLRIANGIDVSSEVSAADRLRFDEQIVRAADHGAGHDLGQPGLWEVLRYGIVPRFLDPNRQNISSGYLINEYLGGTSTSAYTFLPVTTAWFFWGSMAVVLLYAVYAVTIMALCPWRSIERRPYALVLLSLMIGGPLAWFSTPPDVSISMLQTLVSVVPVFLLLHVWARDTTTPSSTGPALTPLPAPFPHPDALVAR